MILITGGSGSGKSSYAEKEAVRLSEGGPLYYFAAMKPYGPEAQARISRHRQQRDGRGFISCEAYTDIDTAAEGLPEKSATVLLECVPNLLANEMFDEAFQEKAPAETVRKVMNEIEAADSMCRHLLVITNDIFSDGTQYTGPTEHYLQALAQINRQLAQSAQKVIEISCSVPVILKNDETETTAEKKLSGRRKAEGNGRMELYIGGRAQGKLELVLNRHPELTQEDVTDCAEEPLDNRKKIIYHLQEIYRRQSREEDSPEAYEHITEQILEVLRKQPDTIVIADETGAGVIPADPAEIHFREASGRGLCRIAEQADMVTRVICGLPQRLKG
ncbi:MAG: bifunctional adenosylcobinamide kinase/adenosylcobinamide-phosphate guanylyltransferase [Butyrivibrio sp.]|jgi:adenosylcobinamide kinase/adenosylcobinamide-phosphate guanylyltransferase|nr:bifunctional adenosylcobinamide kinase/adenosylcobinamide-phosphate guanylyltransferase [Butyrivibrio sp.]